MNYFGMILTFMVPGLVIGLTAAACAYDAAGKRRKQQAAIRKAQERANHRTLYICNLSEEGVRRAA
ncbi:MAG: hypothetical protein IJP37_01635 [Clostridia bacterium]|nr:hypothetical protein [Clostridia bacterium]MBR0025839.1 hypothetical protein [Clostridia bacterium]